MRDWRASRAWPILALAGLLVTYGCKGEMIQYAGEGALRDVNDPSRSDDAILVAFLGDSLTEGWGVDAEEAFPAIIGRRLEAAGVPVAILNAGISGDTTRDALARLDETLDARPDLLVVGLGTNDGAWGLPIEASEADLREIVMRSRSSGARVLLLGMLIPAAHGIGYVRSFEAMYANLARAEGIPFVPSLFAEVEGRPDLNFPDMLHPTSVGHVKIADIACPHVEKIVRELHAPVANLPHAK